MELKKIVASVCLALLASSCAVTNKPTFPWGKEFATPGAQIIYEEVERKAEDGKYVAVYKMRTTGLPKDKSYILWLRWIDNRYESSNNIEFNINDSGYVVFLGKEFHIYFKRMFKGERIEQALVSSDGSVKVFSGIIPFPIEAKADGGCSLHIEISPPAGKIFNIIGEGFEPDEVITTISQSDGEVLENEQKVSQEGKFMAVIAPRVIGKSGGKASFTARGENCSVTIYYDWGTAMKQL